MPEQFDQLKQPDEARKAHRRSRAIAAELDAINKELDHAGVVHLADLAPDRPTDVAAQLEAATPAAQDARDKATALRELAGLSDADYPWHDWAKRTVPGQPGSPGMPGGTFRDQLAQWEEVAVQREDEAANPDAYGVDPNTAAWDHAVAESRILALRALIDDLDQKARQHTPKQNRAGRRAAGQRGPAATPDEAEPKP